MLTGSLCRLPKLHGHGVFTRTLRALDHSDWCNERHSAGCLAGSLGPLVEIWYWDVRAGSSDFNAEDGSMGYIHLINGVYLGLYPTFTNWDVGLEEGNLPGCLRSEILYFFSCVVGGSW